jgi:hypothetical protein
VASLGVPVYSVSPKISPKNGVRAVGAVAKLMVEPDIEKLTPGLSITLFRLTIMANAVGGLNGIPLTVMLNVCCTPLKVKLSILRY